MLNMLNMLNNLIEKNSRAKVAEMLNVNTNTVKRWLDLQSIPPQYYFDLAKLSGVEIDYSKFSPKEKDQFFTTDSTAKYCVDKIKEIMDEYDIDLSKYQIIEPSAGSGAFLPYLPDDTISLDIEPQNERIKKQDFLNWKPTTENNIVIGNPPFGLRGHLALRFINHSATFADFVCFILPPLFNSDGKGTPKKRVQGMTLLHTEDIGNKYLYPNGTEVNVNTILQIWTRLPIVEREEENLEQIGYKIYSLSDGGTPSTTRNKEKLYTCDFYLSSTCFGEDNMITYYNFEDLPQRRGYGIEIQDIALKEKIEQINWKEKAFLSTNNALNLRTSIIVKAINEAK